MARLSVLGLGLAIGVIWGLGMLIVGLVGMNVDYGVAFVNAMGSVYVGYTNTLMGSILGGIWGFVDGFVFGALVAWLYNVFSPKNG